jgi:hypothetical protein
VADTLNLALGVSSYSQGKVIAVSAMEAIGLAGKPFIDCMRIAGFQGRLQYTADAKPSLRHRLL